jgi:hypothetical protein
MTTTTQARIAVGSLFVVTALAGAALVYSHWSNVSVPTASGRAILFVVIMACVSLAGYLLYEKQYDAKLIEAVPEGMEFEFSPLYWPALKFGISVQAILGILMALMLDGGRSFELFKVAFLSHWCVILLSAARRPTWPTKTDIIFIRWGTPLLMLAVGAIAPFVWKIIGESDVSGWQRLWSGWTRR